MNEDDKPNGQQGAADPNITLNSDDIAKLKSAIRVADGVCRFSVQQIGLWNEESPGLKACAALQAIERLVEFGLDAKNAPAVRMLVDLCRARLDDIEQYTNKFLDRE